LPANASTDQDGGKGILYQAFKSDRLGRRVSMTDNNINAELAVIGGGGAGLAAALAAAENGCKSIVVLEKSGSATGSTGMAHDIFGAESPVQKRWGIDAPKDELFKVAMEWAHWTKINPRIVRTFIDKSGDTIGWLEKMGLSFEQSK
jgi:fumarate reductase flavoprotein subunit